jgi:hypothetical protein
MPRFYLEHSKWRSSAADTQGRWKRLRVKAKHKGFVVVTGEDLLRHKEINEGPVTKNQFVHAFSWHVVQRGRA